MAVVQTSVQISGFSEDAVQGLCPKMKYPPVRMDGGYLLLPEVVSCTYIYIPFMKRVNNSVYSREALGVVKCIIF